MKRLRDIETDEVQLEVFQCDCGFVIGLDFTYIDQVGLASVLCPSCHAVIVVDEELMQEQGIIHDDVDPFVCPYCGAKGNDTYLQEEKNHTEYLGCRVCGGSWKSMYEEERVYGPIEEVDPPKRPVQKGAPDA